MAPNADKVAVLRCEPQCLACGRTHTHIVRLQPDERDPRGLATTIAKARVQAELKAIRCQCGVTLGEAAEAHRRRAAGTLS